MQTTRKRGRYLAVGDQDNQKANDNDERQYEERLFDEFEEITLFVFLCHCKSVLVYWFNISTELQILPVMRTSY